MYHIIQTQLTADHLLRETKLDILLVYAIISAEVQISDKVQILRGVESGFEGDWIDFNAVICQEGSLISEPQC